jgi:hypothetical protein
MFTVFDNIWINEFHSENDILFSLPSVRNYSYANIKHKLFAKLFAFNTYKLLFSNIATNPRSRNSDSLTIRMKVRKNFSLKNILTKIFNFKDNEFYRTSRPKEDWISLLGIIYQLFC